MIEKVVLDYLETELKTVDVFMEVPAKDEPAEYVLLEKTGGSETNHIRSAMIAVQAIAESLYEAAQLIETVKTVMDDIVELPEIGSCTINGGPYNFTDTSTKRYRYQIIYDLVHY